VFLAFFDPNDTSPDIFYDRDDVAPQLQKELSKYLDIFDSIVGRQRVILGEKGVGKTTLIRKLLRDAKFDSSGHTLSVYVDCRRLRSAREMLRAIGAGIHGEVLSLIAVEPRKDKKKTLEGLEKLVRVFSSLAAFDSVEIERSRVYETVVQYKAAASLSVKSLTTAFSASLGFSLDIREIDAETLVGKILIDDNRLTEMVCRLFEDLRRSELDVVLALDNVDELQHDVRTKDELQRVRIDVETVLRLREAPIALLVGMRTYFEEVLDREFSRPTLLERLKPDDLRGLLEHRLSVHPEDIETQSYIDSAPCRDSVERLSLVAPTTLAFLNWFQYLCDVDLLGEDNLQGALDRIFATRHSAVGLETIRRIVLSFVRVDDVISVETLLNACEGNKAGMAQARQHQIVLPRDFWNPVEFTLAPEFHWMHPDHKKILHGG